MATLTPAEVLVIKADLKPALVNHLQNISRARQALADALQAEDWKLAASLVTSLKEASDKLHQSLVYWLPQFSASEAQAALDAVILS